MSVFAVVASNAKSWLLIPGRCFSQLLAKERVFDEQVMLTAREVDDQVAGARSVGWSRLPLDALLYGMCDESKSFVKAEFFVKPYLAEA